MGTAEMSFTIFERMQRINERNRIKRMAEAINEIFAHTWMTQRHEDRMQMLLDRCTEEIKRLNKELGI